MPWVSASQRAGVAPPGAMRSWYSRAGRRGVCHGGGVDALVQLPRGGFDLAHAFDPAAVAGEPGLAVLGGAERLGLLIGNTRALWPPLAEAMREPALAAARDPL